MPDGARPTTATRVPPASALLAELLADLIRAPHMAEEHLDREKDVILSEIGETVDSPDDLVNDHLFEAAFVDQPLGRSILGREESLESIGREDCLAWMSGELVPSRLILSASGKVDPDEVLKSRAASAHGHFRARQSHRRVHRAAPTGGASCQAGLNKPRLPACAHPTGGCPRCSLCRRSVRHSHAVPALRETRPGLL